MLVISVAATLRSSTLRKGRMLSRRCDVLSAGTGRMRIHDEVRVCRCMIWDIACAGRKVVGRPVQVEVALVRLPAFW